MTHFNKTLTGLTAIFIAASGTAFADAHAGFDVTTARADVAFDTNGDGMVSDEELIDGNMAVFDANGDGVLDAQERGIADDLVMNGGMIDPTMVTEMASSMPMTSEIDLAQQRLNVALDTNGDGTVSDEEIIAGNMSLFDTNGDGTLDAQERGIADEAVRTGSMAAVNAPSTDGMSTDVLMGLDVTAARTDVALDTNGDGMVSDEEIIDANMALFDTNGDGAIDAQERGIAEEALNNA